MASNSRRAKSNDVAPEEPPTSAARRSDSRKLRAGSKPSSREEQKKQETTLPGWVRERYDEASRGSPRKDPDPLHGSEEFLNVAEAAAVLRISERTLRRHLAEGKIAHIRAGRQIRIPRTGLLSDW